MGDQSGEAPFGKDRRAGWAQNRSAVSLLARVIMGVVLLAVTLFFILSPAYMKGNSVTVMVTLTAAGLLYIGLLVGIWRWTSAPPKTS